MKKIKLTLKQTAFWVLLLITTTITAQNINTSLAADINSKFSLLEKNRIPNHMLLDYGFDLIDVTQFDGVLRSTNYLDLERYNLIYNTMVSSATQLNINGIEPPQQELTEWKNLQKQQNSNAKLNNKASIVLNGLLFNYAKINANALNNNKISVVNDKYDDKYSNGIWQNPYDNKQSFAIVSPVFAISKSNVEVTLPTTLWHSNASITAIEIDFGNNTGYKSLNNGAIAATNYPATGVYTWTYRVRLTNGQYKYCRQKVKITQVDTTAQARNPACGQPQIVPITAIKAYQGVLGSATLQIDYGSNNCTLQNPLIVVEGLDTGLMAQAGSIGDSDIRSFSQSVIESTSLELRNLITNNTAVDYDIVYVNWDNGTDYIQRNAYVLEAVIQWVNDQKAIAGSTAPNVILGQSMGGLITRYALKDMENNAENHDTSLYISHDAPHQGAHIPLGLLHMGRHIVNEFIQTPLGNISIPVNGAGDFGLATIDHLLDAPAINQMLINNVDTNGNRTNTTHSAWQTELQAMGYPQQTRNIALSNASHCGNSQGLSSNQGLVTVTGEGGTSVLTSIIELLFINLDPAVGIALNDVSAALLGFLPGNSSLDLEFRANTFPSSGTARIYKGRLTYEKTFLWLIPITRTIFNKSVNSQFNDKFIDNYPGGISPNGLAMANNGGTSNWFYNYDYNIDVNLNFDFIPVTSALDVGSGYANLNDSDYYRQYTSANPPTGNRAIPFVNFTTSSNQNNSLNAEHISFNRRNGDWLALELDDITNNEDDFDCTAYCSTIIGDDYLCDTSIYSVTDTATTVYWSINDSNNLVNYIINGNEISITPTTTGGSGYFTLQVAYSNNKCGSNTISQQIWVGKPNVTTHAILGGWDNQGINSSSQLHVDWAEEATEYYWFFGNVGAYTNCAPNDRPKFLTNNGYASTITSPSRYVSINWGKCTGDFVVNCKAVNDCGMTGISHKIVQVYDPNDNNTDPCDQDPWSLKTYPNPIKKGSLTVSKVAPGLPCNERVSKKRTLNNVKIYDFYGILVYKDTFKANDFTIEGLNLKEGHYVLHVTDTNGETLRKLIIVE